MFGEPSCFGLGPQGAAPDEPEVGRLSQGLQLSFDSSQFLKLDEGGSVLLVLSGSCKSSLQEVIILVLDISTNDFATTMFRAHIHTTWQRTKLPQNPRTIKNQTHDEIRQCEQICKITSSLDVGVMHADLKKIFLKIEQSF